MEYKLSSNGIENYIADLKLYISKKENSQTADRMISAIGLLHQYGKSQH